MTIPSRCLTFALTLAAVSILGPVASAQEPHPTLRDRVLAALASELCPVGDQSAAEQVASFWRELPPGATNLLLELASNDEAGTRTRRAAVGALALRQDADSRDALVALAGVPGPEPSSAVSSLALIALARRSPADVVECAPSWLARGGAERAVALQALSWCGDRSAEHLLEQEITAATTPGDQRVAAQAHATWVGRHTAGHGLEVTLSSSDDGDELHVAVATLLEKPASVRIVASSGVAFGSEASRDVTPSADGSGLVVFVAERDPDVPLAWVLVRLEVDSQPWGETLQLLSPATRTGPDSGERSPRAPAVPK